MLTTNGLLKIIQEKTKYLEWSDSTRITYVFSLDDLVNTCYLELYPLVGKELDQDSLDKIDSVIKNHAIRRGRESVTTVGYLVDLADSETELDLDLERYRDRLGSLLDEMGCNALIEPLITKIKEL